MINYDDDDDYDDDDNAELSTGRMDPRVGSGRGFGSRFCRILAGRVGSGRVSTSNFLVFYWLFLGT